MKGAGIFFKKDFKIFFFLIKKKKTAIVALPFHSRNERISEIWAKCENSFISLARRGEVGDSVT